MLYLEYDDFIHIKSITNIDTDTTTHYFYDDGEFLEAIFVGSEEEFTVRNSIASYVEEDDTGFYHLVLDNGIAIKVISESVVYHTKFYEAFIEFCSGFKPIRCKKKKSDKHIEDIFIIYFDMLVEEEYSDDSGDDEYSGLSVDDIEPVD